MKRVLHIIFYVFINLLLLVLAVFIYSTLTSRLNINTEELSHVEFIIELILITAFIVLISFTKNKYIKRFFFGLLSMSTTTILLLFAFLNTTFRSPGEYKRIALSQAEIIDGNCYLYTSFDYNSTINFKIEVEPDKCILVDSIDVIIDEGFLGFDIITDQVKIVESPYVREYNAKLDEEFDSIHPFLSEGHYYAKRRDFTKAIKAYSNEITTNPLFDKGYYHRALMYLGRKDYKNALRDFISGAYLIYQKHDSTDIKRLEELNEEMSNMDLYIINQIKNDNPDIPNLDDIISLIEFSDYYQYIKYCSEKVK